MFSRLAAPATVTTIVLGLQALTSAADRDLAIGDATLPRREIWAVQNFAR